VLDTLDLIKRAILQDRAQCRLKYDCISLFYILFKSNDNSLLYYEIVIVYGLQYITNYSLWLNDEHVCTLSDNEVI